MQLTIYQIDAFTNKLFGGNPAAVIPLQHWLDIELMQTIAIENNLSETVYFIPGTTPDADYDIRWFTPAVEVNLCGHATLATAFVLFNMLGYNKPAIRFNSQSGVLTVTKIGDMLTMDFPGWKPTALETIPSFLSEVLDNVSISGVFKHRDMLVLLKDEAAVKNCKPDFTLMKRHFDKIIITAPGDEVDLVSRFFAPASGIDEDPVTGSAHSQLIPFWSERLGKNKLHALQLSARGGELWCEQLNEERVLISGQCVFYMKGEITV